MKKRTKQILGVTGIVCAIAGGLFTFMGNILIAIPLWLIAGAIIMVQKKKRTT